MSTIRTFIFPLLLIIGVLISACQNGNQGDPEVTVYTHRHYDTDQELFKQFTETTGIKVNVVNASADELITKMEQEGKLSPADVLITVDAGRLARAKSKGLLQAVQSQTLDENIPSHLRDAENHWFGLTKRARIIVYSKDRIDPSQLSTYEALADSSWKGKILIRPSSNIYNQSLLASIVANNGEEAATAWAKAVRENMARDPKGNDRDQAKAVVAGEGDLAVMNSYYVGRMLSSEDSAEVEVANKVGLFFPNQQDRGTHVNVSGAGVALHAPHKENGIRFIEFLSGLEAQKAFSERNFEYPINPKAETSELLNSWGSFKEDNLVLSKLGEYNDEAVRIFGEVGW